MLFPLNFGELSNHSTDALKGSSSKDAPDNLHSAFCAGTICCIFRRADDFGNLRPRRAYKNFRVSNLNGEHPFMSTSKLELVERELPGALVIDVVGELTVGSGTETLLETVRRHVAAGHTLLLVNLSKCRRVDS